MFNFTNVSLVRLCFKKGQWLNNRKYLLKGSLLSRDILKWACLMWRVITELWDAFSSAFFCPQSNGSLGWCQSHKQCAKVISVKITQHFTAAWYKSQHRSVRHSNKTLLCLYTSRNDIIHHCKSYCISYCLGLLYLASRLSYRNEIMIYWQF